MLPRDFFPDPTEDPLRQPIGLKPETAAPASFFPPDPTDRLTNGMQRAATLKPDTAARIFQAQLKTGLPHEVIERNLDEIERQAAAQNFDAATFRQQSPQLATWLEQHPLRGALTQDDLVPLTTIERTLGVGRNLIGAAGAGVLDFGQQAWGLMQAMAERGVLRQAAFAAAERGPEVTKLTASEETAFQQWAATNKITDVDQAESFYDYRGFWKETGGPTMQFGVDHFPDTYKQHGHPTFSVESKYANGPMDAGSWDGETFTPPQASSLARLADFARASAIVAGSLAERVKGPQAGAGFVERGIYSGVESLGQMAPALVLGAVGGEAAMLSAIGLTTAGGTYAQARQQGVSPSKALGVGAIQGVVEVGTEFIPAHRLLGDLAAKSGLLKTLAHQLVPEIAGEEVATVLQDLNEWAFLPENKDRAFADYLKQRPSAAAATLISTITAVGATSVMAHGTARMLEQLGVAAQDSKTLQRAPDQVRDLVDQIAGKDTTIGLPVDTFTTYWQAKGIDPAQMAAQLTGDPEAYARATQSGEDLQVPASRYLTDLAATEHNAFFSQEARLTPEALNVRETKALDAQATAALEAGPSEPTDTERLHTELVTRLTEGGRLDRSAAETVASVFAGAFPNVSERSGLDLQPLIDKWVPEVQSVDEAPGIIRPGKDNAPAIAPAETGIIRPTATFLAHGPSGPLYNIVGGPQDRSTVSAAKLQELGIAVPETPPATGAQMSGDELRKQAMETRAAARLDKTPPVPESGGTSDVSAQPQAREGTGGPGLPARNRIAPSTPRISERPAQRTAREAAHVEGLATHYTDAARAVDPTVDPAEIRAELDYRLSVWNDLRHTLIDSGKDPRDLLTAIAAAGGLNETSASGWRGELRDLKAGTKFGAVAGVRNVFRAETTVDDAGRPVTGLPFDVMWQRLQQDSRFAWIENVNMLFDALDEIVRNPPNLDTLPGTEELRADVRIDDRTAWWKDSWRPLTPEQEAAQDEATRAAEQATEGDPSFNVDEFNQSAVSSTHDAWQQRVDQARTELATAHPEWSAIRLQLEAARAVGPEPHEFNLDEFDQLNRGAMAFRPGQPPLLKLFEGRDLSTVFHEVGGHLFLELMGDVTDQIGQLDPESLTPSQRRLLADYGDVLTWLGVENRGDIGTDQHEQFARGFEAYLFEGRAPSLSLRRTFARVRAWLLSIYRSASALHVTLTPEVRAVFDRLLVSDQAIAEAEAARQVAPLFTTPESVGMSPEEFARYQEKVQDASRTAREDLDRQLLAEVRREQTAAWKSQRAAIERDVTDDLHAQPVYQALAAMQRGTYPSGESLVDGKDPEPLKLSKQAIVDRYGKERLATLPRPYVYTVEGGIDPNTVAELYGFSSGDELLTAIEQAPRLKDAIARETDRRMLDQHGSLLLDGTLPDAAREAVANEHRDEVITAELTALVKAMRARTRGGPPAIRAAIPPAAVLRELAKDRLASTRIRQIRPQEFWSASRRAAQQAIDRAVRQDFDGAIVAKQQELMNLAFYREAERAVDAVRDGQAYAQSLTTKATRARIGLAGGSWLDQLDGVLDQYSFAPASPKVLDRLVARRTWVDGLEAQGLPVDLPEALLDDTRKRNYQELTLEEFLGVVDGLKAIVHAAALKNRLLKAVDQREYAAVRDGLVDSIRDKNPAKPRTLEFRPADQRVRAVADWFASHRKISDLLQSLDGYVDGGPLWTAIMQPLNAAADAEQVRKGEAGKAYATILETHYPGRALGTLNEKQFIPAIGASLSKEGRLAIALNWGNQTSRDRVLADPTLRVTEAQVGAILDTLDQRDWNFVQATWDHLNTYWPEIAAKQKRVTGLEPEKVAALAVQTKYGEYAGGYYPLAYDSRKSPRTAQLEAVNQAKLATSAAYVRSTTKRGHVETRLQNVTLPIRLELSVAFNHLEQVLHDLTHHETLIDVTRLLRDPKVSGAIYETQGDQVYQQISNGVKDIAIGSTPAAITAMDKAATYMRTGTQIAGLGWNVWTAAQQPLGLFNGAARVGPTWVARGLGRWLRDAASMESTATWIASVSPMMRERVTTGTQDLHDLRAAFRRPGGWFDTALRRVSGDRLTQQTITDGYLWHIGLMQRVADIPIWLGQYEKSMAGGEPEARAIALADQAVLDSQGGGQVKDLASIQRGGPTARLFMTFYSYGNTVLNATAREVGRAEFKSPAQVVELLGHLSLLYVMPAVATVALSRAFGKTGGGDDDTPEGWIADIGRETLSTALNTMVLVRELDGLVQEGTRGYAGPAGTRTVELLYNLGAQIKQGEADEGLLKAINSAAGVLFRYPAQQAQRTVDGWVALHEGRTSNPMALLTGPPPKQKAQ